MLHSYFMFAYVCTTQLAADNLLFRAAPCSQCKQSVNSLIQCGLFEPCEMLLYVL